MKSNRRPSIRTAIYGGDAIITGNFGEQEARGLASVLENPLQTPVSVEEERSVSPTLGADSVRSSVLAGLVGLLDHAGLRAFLLPSARAGRQHRALINLVLLIGALTMFNFVLTLPGIAGIILTIGMAVDANVLIYERLREELALGKSLKTAHAGRLRQSLQLHLGRERDDRHHRRDSFLESDRPGEGIRHLPDPRNRVLDVRGADLRQEA